MPATWTVASAAELLRLGAFIDLKDGNHGSNHPKVAEFTEQGLPFITAAQVNNFNIDYDGAYKVSGGPLRRLRVGFAKPGDVIFTHKGSVGRVAVADRDCVLTPQTTYYRVAEDVFVNRYLMLFLASQPFAAQVAVVKEQTTRDFVPISEQYLLFHRIPPLAEQQEIVRRVESLFAYADSIDARYAKAHNQVNNIAQSIIAKAFRGDLVPTEVELAEAESRPYETGAELLDRIRRAGPTVAMRRASINRPATSNRGLKARGTKR
jgi:type I restriction enzyme S subunit